MSIERIKNWVVVMFENRSFDNLLGHLPHIDAKDGIRDREILLPYPKGQVRVHETTRVAAPTPDPGESYSNVNIQLWNQIIPPTNAGKHGYPIFPDPMQPPHNLPTNPGVPTMDGFALDYYWMYQWEKGVEPNEEQMSEIGAVYTPKTAPVINRLAQEYAVFTNWFCEAPTCTFPNRSFFHTGTSMGMVDNDNIVSYLWNENARSLFDLLSDKGVDWKVYFGKDQIIPDVAINLAGARKRKMWKTHSAYTEQFFADAAAGTLPTYSWVEPNMLFGMLNDYHPPHDIRLGESFLAQIYNALRESPQWESTALLVLFDEHGGTYDHVPPPAAVIPDDYPGEQGFTFDRFGVRVPALLISPYTKRGTVISDRFHSASFLHTMRELYDLGPALSKRDEVAPSLEVAFNRSEPRQGVHSVKARPVDWTPPTDEEKAAAIGDVPDLALVMAKQKELLHENISQLGGVTLRNIARIAEEDPDSIPAKATHARQWVHGLIGQKRLIDLPKIV